MFCGRRSIAAVLTLSASWLSGCHYTHAQSAPAHRSTPKQQAPSPPFAKRPSRDSAFATYHNPTYGVSFHYPRNFLLAEYSDSEEYRSPIEARRGLAAWPPRSILVATVTIPADAYPNTSFLGGSLQLALNPTVGPEACRSFAAPDDDPYTFGSTTIPGITLDWRQRDSAAAGSASLERDYAGFSSGTCYEFFLQVVASSSPERDLHIQEADAIKIMRQLNKIVSSLEIHSPSSSSPLPKTPSRATPLAPSS
jgi:hypothetical protein